jgi:hypothetical protein
MDDAPAALGLRVYAAASDTDRRLRARPTAMQVSQIARPERGTLNCAHAA